MQGCSCQISTPLVARPVRSPLHLRPSTFGRPIQRGLPVQAAAEGQPQAKLPKGVTEPAKVPESPKSWFGFVDNAERINSRAAMIGFFSLIILEAILGKGLLQYLHLGVGSGLGFEL